MAYTPQSGSNEEVIHSNPEQVEFEIASVKYTINTSAGTYSPEWKTTNYHQKLFEEIENVKKLWEQTATIAKDYGKNMVIVPEPETLIPTMLDEDIEGEKVEATTTEGTSYHKGNVRLNNDSDSLNVRSEGSNGGIRLSGLNQDAEVQVFSVTEDGWLQIKSGDQEGFVYGEKVVFQYLDQNPNHVLTNTSGDRITVTGENGKILCNLANDSKVNVLGEKDGMLKINVLGTVGYISKEFAKGVNS